MKTHFDDMQSAFSYALTKINVLSLSMGALFFQLLMISCMMVLGPFSKPFVFLIGVLFFGAIFLRYRLILRGAATASNDNEWDDPQDFFENCGRAVFQIVGSSAYVIVPFVIVVKVVSWGPKIYFIAVFAATFYFPMVVLAVSILESTVGPRLVFKSIRCTLQRYWVLQIVTLILFGFCKLLVTKLAVMYYVSSWIKLPILTLVLVYCAGVHARYLGTFYYREQENLDW